MRCSSRIYRRGFFSLRTLWRRSWTGRVSPMRGSARSPKGQTRGRTLLAVTSTPSARTGGCSRTSRHAGAAATGTPRSLHMSFSTTLPESKCPRQMGTPRRMGKCPHFPAKCLHLGPECPHLRRTYLLDLQRTPIETTSKRTFRPAHRTTGHCPSPARRTAFELVALSQRNRDSEPSASRASSQGRSARSRHDRSR